MTSKRSTFRPTVQLLETRKLMAGDYFTGGTLDADPSSGGFHDGGSLVNGFRGGVRVATSDFTATPHVTLDADNTDTVMERFEIGFFAGRDDLEFFPVDQ